MFKRKPCILDTVYRKEPFTIPTTKKGRANKVKKIRNALSYLASIHKHNKEAYDEQTHDIILLLNAIESCQRYKGEIP